MAAPRILITYPFPLGRATGGARMTREIARHLGRAGARVSVLPVSAAIGRGLFPRPRLPEEFAGHEFDEGLARDGVDVVRVPRHPLHWILDARSVRRAVLAIADRERVDAVLSYYAEGALLPAALEPRGIPFGIIATWQSYKEALAAPLPGVPRRFWPAVTRRAAVEPYRRAQVLFATSRFTQEELVRCFGVDPARIRVCPLGVEPAFFAVERPSAPRPVRRILFFGRMIPSKGVGDALEALGHVARHGVEFELRLVGQGQHDWAMSQARAHGIEGRVALRGPASDGELRSELAWADLALLPSHFEAFGLAFAEAQAAGLPVVAFRAGSVGEIVADGETGWLAAPRDVRALADCLRAALADPAEVFARGRAARERVRRHFTWERTAETILAGLAQVSGSSAGARP
jgi:glycosyltransferase involved in cell wall biosynthesis